MSYILDALRKAEKDRRRGSAPDIMTVQDTAEEKPKKRRLSAYLLVAALILNAGVFLWMLRPWQVKEKNAVSPLPVIQHQAVPVGNNQESGAVKKDAAALPDSDGKSSSNEKAALKSAPAPKAVTERTPPIPAPVRAAIQYREATKQTKVDSQPHTQSKSIPEGRVYTVKDLPDSVRQGLPKITLSVHYYDTNPALRMVSINNRTVREGEEFGSGLKLQEIAADGAVFTFQGYRIHLGLPK